MYNYSSKKQHDFCLHNNKILVMMMVEDGGMLDDYCSTQNILLYVF